MMHIRENFNIFKGNHQSHWLKRQNKSTVEKFGCVLGICGVSQKVLQNILQNSLLGDLDMNLYFFLTASVERPTLIFAHNVPRIENASCIHYY